MIFEKSGLLEEFVLYVVFIKFYNHILKDIGLLKPYPEKCFKLIETPFIEIGHIMKPEPFIHGSIFLSLPTIWPHSSGLILQMCLLLFVFFAYLFWVVYKTDFARYQGWFWLGVVSVIPTHSINFPKSSDFNSFLRLNERYTKTFKMIFAWSCSMQMLTTIQESLRFIDLYFHLPVLMVRRKAILLCERLIFWQRAGILGALLDEAVVIIW